jgi:hypothetical protein
MNEGKCDSCRADVLWRKTPGGKWMPVDPEPSDHGNVIVLDAERCRVVGGAAAVEHRAGGGKTYVPHFATCPNAARHRKRG